jgi:AraC family transcriptional regulator
MKVEIATLSPARIAYLRHMGSYGAELGPFWQQFNAACAKAGLSGNMYGIGHDDPTHTPPSECRYDACIEIAADAAVPGGFQTARLPGGKYALGEFRGTSAEMPEAWEQMTGHWMPKSGMQLDARPMFELYRASDTNDTVSGAFSCAICLPVAPLV